MSSDANLIIVMLAAFTWYLFIYLFISPLKLQLLALRSCLAFVPTLKSSADTGVRNVPWYLMSGSILASFSLAFWRIRAADSWCEILAVSHSLMTVAHETAQVKIIQKKIITFVSNNSFLTGMKQMKLSVSKHRASKDFVENHQQLSSVWIRGFFFFF